MLIAVWMHGRYLLLQWAALNNKAEMVSFLLQVGAQVDATDDVMGQAAIHWAAVNNGVEALEALVAGGAHISLADPSGFTCIHVAAQYGHKLFLYRLLKQHGQDLNQLDSAGRSCLHWAAYKGARQVILRIYFARMVECHFPQPTIRMLSITCLCGLAFCTRTSKAC